MSRLPALLSNLPKPYSRDPQAVPAITLRFNLGARFIVDDLRLRSAPVSGTALDISLRTITMTQLVASVNAVSGYTAAVVGSLGAIKAYALIEATYDGSGGITVNVPYFTAPNHQVLAPIAQSLDDLDDAWRAAIDQTDLRRATGVWLDRLGLVYGVTRFAAEPDVSYARRVTASVIAVKCNGRAIELILSSAMGISASIADVPPSRFTTTVVISDTSGNPYDTTTVNTLIDVYKTFGTINTLVLQTAASETETMAGYSDSLDSDSVGTGSGEWGRPEWAARQSGL